MVLAFDEIPSKICKIILLVFKPHSVIITMNSLNNLKIAKGSYT